MELSDLILSYVEQSVELGELKVDSVDLVAEVYGLLLEVQVFLDQGLVLVQDDGIVGL